MSARSDSPAFDAPYAADDVEIARDLFGRVQFSGEQSDRIRQLSAALIRSIRQNSGAFGGVEELQREYSLSSREGLALMVQQHLKRDPHGGDLFVFRGRAGSLVKIIWHDGLGMSLYAKRLEKGRFIWPQAKDGVVALTSAQLACLLDGIDWRNPQYSWRPASAR